MCLRFIFCCGYEFFYCVMLDVNLIVCVLGLIFVVDSNDRERIIEVREELIRMFNEDEFRDVVFLVFCNK